MKPRLLAPLGVAYAALSFLLCAPPAHAVSSEMASGICVNHLAQLQNSAPRHIHVVSAAPVAAAIQVRGVVNQQSGNEAGFTCVVGSAGAADGRVLNVEFGPPAPGYVDPGLPPQARYGGPSSPYPGDAPHIGVVDLVGAAAGFGESELQRRGYAVVASRGRSQWWWNTATRNCVRAVTSDGRYQGVAQVPAGDCSVPVAAAPVAPVAATSYDGYRRPDVPQHVLDACLRRADQIQSMPSGPSSVYRVNELSQGDYLIVVSSAGQTRARCVVSADGFVRDIRPGG